MKDSTIKLQCAIVVILTTFFTIGVKPIMASNFTKHDVLVVMSYEQNNPWCREIKDGIEKALNEKYRATYFYMDTKIDMSGGKSKAREAYALYQNLRPKGVITADDNAQWMFVLPYLKNKVETPVMFCGVNASPEKYGYPASNVSGILERGHIKESIAFVKQLTSEVATIGFITKISPSGSALFNQVSSESDDYLLKVTAKREVKTLNELRTVSADMRQQSDVLFVDSMEGILDDTGTGMNNKEITKSLQKYYGLKIVGSNRYHVENGALCAVVKTGQEQGRTAAEMLIMAMEGTPISKIGIRKNHNGKRLLNVETMRAARIKPKHRVLRGVELVKTKMLIQ
jgi:ABC-type uncharacterized transport system substrate-binding protein